MPNVSTQNNPPLVLPKPSEKDTQQKHPLPPLTPPKKEVQVQQIKEIKSDDFEEFVIKDKHLGEIPVISFTFGEEPTSSTWVINLLWPTEQKHISWRGKFIFRIGLYKKTDDNTMKKVFSAISSPFLVFSKPNVYFSKAVR